MTAVVGQPLSAANLLTWAAMHTHVLALLDHLPAEHPDTLEARHGLANWTGEAGDAVRARDLFAELVPARERVLGTEHPDTLVTRHSLARWTGEAGDAVRARDLAAEVLPVQERVIGIEHPDTVITRLSLANWTGEAGDAVRAQAMFADVLPVQERVMGTEHPDTLLTRAILAWWIGQAGKCRPGAGLARQGATGSGAGAGRRAPRYFTYTEKPGALE